MKKFARTLAGVLLPLSFATAQAVYAGTAYVPLPGVSSLGPVTYETQILISNGTTQQRTLNYLQMNSGVDGTKRPGVNPTPLPVAANKTFVLKPSATARGLLEMNGPVGLEYSARLVRTGAVGFGVELPVITSENMGRADDKLVVQGLKGSGTMTTDVIIVNLAKSASTCSATIMRADGTAAFPPAALSLLPLSHLFFPSVFSPISGGITDARVEVTCKNDFYVYAQMNDSATGEFAIAVPSQSSDSTLTAPGEAPSGLSCSTGTACYVFPGLVHTSTKADPDRSIILSPPLAPYSSVKVHLEVQINDWSQPVSGAHGVMYFVRNKNKDMFANIFMRGPGRNLLTLRHGFDQVHGDKAKIEKGFTPQLGQTYAFDYDYDPVRKTITLRISQNGTLLAEMTDRPNVNRVHIEEGDRIILGLSNPGINPVEPASIGWRYSNVKVEFFP